MSFSKLRAQCMACEKCELCKTRHNVVFGIGPEDAEIMIVGEGPGENEDLTGEPFVGNAGKLLDDMLHIIGLDRHKNVYITNIVKCRPPKNRDPLPSEQDMCIGYLREQFSLLRPKVVICLGRIAAMSLIKSDFRITREHGIAFDKGGTKFIAIYHPAALLYDESKMPETFVDLKRIRALVMDECKRTDVSIF